MTIASFLPLIHFLQYVIQPLASALLQLTEIDPPSCHCLNRILKAKGILFLLPVHPCYLFTTGKSEKVAIGTPSAKVYPDSL